jgi:hypothetical protein
MENCFTREVNLTYESENLKKLIAAFREFVLATSTFGSELEEICKEMDEVKRSLGEKKQNNHYISCPWSKDICEIFVDSCECNYRVWSPSIFIRKLLLTIGTAYILWSCDNH